MKKVLLVGGNGALGVYLTEEALKKGYKVDVLCFEDELSRNENLTYIRHDGKDYGVSGRIWYNIPHGA